MTRLCCGTLPLRRDHRGCVLVGRFGGFGCYFWALDVAGDAAWQQGAATVMSSWPSSPLGSVCGAGIFLLSELLVHMSTSDFRRGPSD